MTREWMPMPERFEMWKRGAGEHLEGAERVLFERDMQDAADAERERLRRVCRSPIQREQIFRMPYSEFLELARSVHDREREESLLAREMFLRDTTLTAEEIDLLGNGKLAAAIGSVRERTDCNIMDAHALCNTHMGN